MGGSKVQIIIKVKEEEKKKKTQISKTRKFYKITEFLNFTDDEIIFKLCDDI